MEKLPSFDEPLLVSWFLSIFIAISYQPPNFFCGRRFFEEPCQIVHLGVMEGLVWFTSPKMLHRKYIENYCMTYLAFQSLLLELMLYIILDVVNRWVNPPLDL
jgi:hypothetical protein